MNDPHVESLTYVFTTYPPAPVEDFSHAEPLDCELSGFDCHLEKRILTARPREHFGDEASARAALEPSLWAWETLAEIEGALRSEFRFRKAHVIDRNPLPVDPRHVTGTGHLIGPAVGIASVGTVTYRRPHAQFPRPPTSFAVTPLVARLAGYLRALRQGSRLLAIAYLVLTDLEEFGAPIRTSTQRRKKGARRLNVDVKVLDRIGQLADVNDPRHNRKAEGPERLLTPAEIQWLHSALSGLVVRAGEVGTHGENAEHLPQLTIQSFE